MLILCVMSAIFGRKTVGRPVGSPAMECAGVQTHGMGGVKPVDDIVRASVRARAQYLIPQQGRRCIL